MSTKRESAAETRAKYAAIAAECPDCQKQSEGHRGGLRFCQRHRMPNVPSVR